MTAPFERYIGIDYSGAGHGQKGLPGLRCYVVRPEQAPVAFVPPGRRKYWGRQQLAEAIEQQLKTGPRTILGIDHSLSFPEAYFDAHGLCGDWDDFLSDFCAHFPTDQPGVTVQQVRDGVVGNGGARTGNSRWRRMCERRTRAKSVFHFDVPGAVAKSTHAGLPWINHWRQSLKEALHVWPFDGFTPNPASHVLVEAYPALYSNKYPQEGRTQDQHDAYAIARFLQESDVDGSLTQWFHPALSKNERSIVRKEGWILGAT